MIQQNKHRRLCGFSGQRANWKCRWWDNFIGKKTDIVALLDLKRMKSFLHGTCKTHRYTQKHDIFDTENNIISILSVNRITYE